MRNITTDENKMVIPIVIYKLTNYAKILSSDVPLIHILFDNMYIYNITPRRKHIFEDTFQF